MKAVFIYICWLIYNQSTSWLIDRLVGWMILIWDHDIQVDFLLVKLLSFRYDQLFGRSTKCWQHTNLSSFKLLNAKNSSEILFIQMYLHDFHVIGEFISFLSYLYHDQKGFKK